MGGMREVIIRTLIWKLKIFRGRKKGDQGSFATFDMLIVRSLLSMSLIN